MYVYTYVKEHVTTGLFLPLFACDLLAFFWCLLLTMLGKDT